MQFALLIQEDESRFERMSAAEDAALMEATGQAIAPLREAGGVVASGRLRPTEAATTVRVRDGERLVTDGPYLETKEQLGGFIVIDVPSLDEAIAVAATIPSARHGGVEIRPLFEH